MYYCNVLIHCIVICIVKFIAVCIGMFVYVCVFKLLPGQWNITLFIAFQALHANMNELIVFQDFARYHRYLFLVVRHIVFHGSEPLSRQESASQEDFFINSFGGFSYACMHACMLLYSLRNSLEASSNNFSEVAAKPTRKVAPCGHAHLWKYETMAFAGYIRWPEAFQVLAHQKHSNRSDLELQICEMVSLSASLHQWRSTCSTPTWIMFVYVCLWRGCGFMVTDFRHLSQWSW